MASRADVATTVAAVIGNFDGAAHLPACLTSLAAQSMSPVETIVVDAGSSDDSVAVARSHGARVVETENRGLGHLYNRGVAATSADLVLVANNDLAFDPECLRRLAEPFEERPSLFAADPTQLDWTEERVIHARTTLARGPLLRTPIPGIRVNPLVPADAVAATAFANAGVMLVRRDIFIELGGFDETFFLDFEDLDLCWRAQLRGFDSVYVPAARVRHKVGMSASSTVTPRRLRAAHHNVLRFALKCLPPGPAARVVLGESLRLLLKPTIVAPAVAAIARELPEILRARRALRPQRAVFDRLLEGTP